MTPIFRAPSVRPQARLAHSPSQRTAGDSSGPLPHPGVTGGGTAHQSVVDQDRALALADLGRCLELLLRRREQEVPLGPPISLQRDFGER